MARRPGAEYRREAVRWSQWSPSKSGSMASPFQVQSSFRGVPAMHAPRTAIRSDSTVPVLIVVDDPCAGETLQSLLAQRGIGSVVACRVKEALAALSHHQPSLLMVDGCHPDGSGFELIGESRSRGFRGQVVIITDPLAPGSCHHVAAEATLTKPLVAAQFLSTVRDCLDAVNRHRRKAHQATSGPAARQKPSTINVGNCELDLADSSLIVNDARVPLTRLEARMLSTLATDVATWVRPEILFPIVWHQPWEKAHDDKCH